MILLDGGLVHLHPAQERIACSRFSRFRHPRGRLWIFCAKRMLHDDDEHEHPVHRKRFSIQVPTIPKIGDIESARRLLESAFQNLSFDMPKIQIDSAIQGLPFAIPKLSFPMGVFVLDITGFVASRLKKRQKKEVEDMVADESQYPRCAWPRTLKGNYVDECGRTGSAESSQNLEICQESFIGPHCAWPRPTGYLANVKGASLSSSSVPYPHCSWPRRAVCSKHAAVVCEQSSGPSVMEKKEIIPCIVEEGPRCAWPRKSIPARQSLYCVDSTDNGEKQDSFATVAEFSDSEAPPAQVEIAAELPRRLLATSVGFTLMNHLAKGSIAMSVFDLCSSLPAGPLVLSDDDVAAMDVGRRTLLVLHQKLH